MDEKHAESSERPPYEVAVMGEASKVTRGLTTLFPWFEAAPPPFDRYCPYC